MDTLTDFLEANRDLYPRKITAGELAAGTDFVFAVGTSYLVTDSGDYSAEELPLGLYQVTDSENMAIGGTVVTATTTGDWTEILLHVSAAGCQYYTLLTASTCGVHASN